MHYTFCKEPSLTLSNEYIEMNDQGCQTFSQANWMGPEHFTIDITSVPARNATTNISGVYFNSCETTVH